MLIRPADNTMFLPGVITLDITTGINLVLSPGQRADLQHVEMA